ncbi:MAG: NeuD/PglB/VioB family sugar acetyltransferase [Candidatus Kapabacteria bacterium]|nr:NeuD/PglB/VioB family sugar acetyltransferase [Candidatus Kapabacteria bacterium]
MSKKVIILGGLGNGTVIAAAMEDANRRGFDEWVFSGYLNDKMEKGEMLEGYPILGSLKDVPKFLDEGYFFINVIYRIDGQEDRVKLFESLNIPDDRLAIFVHPTAYVAPNVKLGPGTVIMPNVSISPGVEFGKCNLVMINAIIGHNTIIGNHCHFAAQCCVSSLLKIGDGVHIGLNATLREFLTIGKNSTIGMGSVLTKNVGEGEIWVGNPAKFLRKAE